MMLFKIWNLMRYTAVQDKGKICLRCGSNNTDIQGGIWYCYDCQKEFG